MWTMQVLDVSPCLRADLLALVVLVLVVLVCALWSDLVQFIVPLGSCFHMSLCLDPAPSNKPRRIWKHGSLKSHGMELLNLSMFFCRVQVTFLNVLDVVNTDVQ